MLNLNSFRNATPEKQAEVLATIKASTDEESAKLLYNWSFWGRENQQQPASFRNGQKQIWMMSAGRGFGKTRTGAETTRDKVEHQGVKRLSLIAATAADARDVMVEGESGIMSVAPPYFRPKYEPSKRRVTWPNGAVATLFSADEPDRLRGPQSEFGWCDEIAQWRYPETWDNFLLGLRLGSQPQACVTTTAKRTKLYKALLVDPTCIVTGGSTYDNAQNLPPQFLSRIIERYKGTTLGRQEIHSELIEDVEGALFKRADIDKWRVIRHPALVRIVTAIDPATTSEDDSDDTGIVAAGIDENGHGYILDDSTLKATPGEWAKRAIGVHARLRGDRLIGEANNGGDLIEYTLRTIDSQIPYKKVTASKGKIPRAEPVAALYEQGKVHHVGNFAMLEDEMTGWTLGQKSPNRMDALVWALTELMLAQTGVSVLFEG